MLVDFKNSFAFGFSKEFAITLLSFSKLHLTCVATLPCEIGKIKNGEILIYSTQ